MSINDERTPLHTHAAAGPISLHSSRPQMATQTSSDYLVLSRIDSHNEDIMLPRPHLWYLLPLFGILDAAFTITAAVKFSVQGKNEITMVIWGLLRALLVMVATSSSRVREVGWLIVGCALISALAALAELNLITQRQAWTSTMPATLALYCFSHVFFGLLHWLSFAAIVGLTRDRNPYGLGLQSVRRRPGPWRGGIANVHVSRGTFSEHDEDNEDVHGRHDGASDGWQRRLRRNRQVNEQSFPSDNDEGEEEETDSYDEHHEESSDNEDDIPIDATMIEYTDEEYDGNPEGGGEDHYYHEPESPRRQELIDIIPSPSTATAARRRTVSQSRSLRSRRSFYAHGSQANSPEAALSPHMLSSEPSPLQVSSGYGTFRSLAGI